MSTPEPPRDLEDLLDAAGRAAQPTAFGWETLPGRLAATPQQQPPPRRWATLPLGIAAAAALFLAFWLGPATLPPTQAGPIEVRRQGVDLTILSAADTDGQTLYMPLVPPQPRGPTRTGQALVRDRRLILNLRKGDNVVRFTDVAATIDPTSVRFESRTDPLGTVVVEQSFEFDLATADALLKRYLDRRVTCIGKDGEERSGYLASYDAQAIVLKKGSGLFSDKGEKKSPDPFFTESIRRRALKAVRLEDMPADLVVRPTLVWKLRTRTPGRHETMLSYICGFVKWQADYVVLVTPGQGGQPERLDVSAWVTIDNTSGTTYPDAGLRLIAGDVHRLRDPWALVKREKQSQTLFLGDTDGPAIYYGYAALGARKEFAQKSFADYHLYALSDPTTIRDRQIKQLHLLERKGVKTTRRYVYDPTVSGHRVAVELLAKNDKEHNLGVPLPKGRVTLEQRDVDGETAVIGRTEIDHTATKEELALKYGYAFDVVGRHREVSTEWLWVDQWQTVYELRVRNHKAEPIAVRAFARRLGQNDTLVEASAAHHHKDAATIYFDFTLPANAERVIHYTVDTRE